MVKSVCSGGARTSCSTVSRLPPKNLAWQTRQKIHGISLLAGVSWSVSPRIWTIPLAAEQMINGGRLLSDSAARAPTERAPPNWMLIWNRSAKTATTVLHRQRLTVGHRLFRLFLRFFTKCPIPISEKNRILNRVGQRKNDRYQMDYPGKIIW